MAGNHTWGCYCLTGSHAADLSFDAFDEAFSLLSLLDCVKWDFPETRRETSEIKGDYL